MTQTSLVLHPALTHECHGAFVTMPGQNNGKRSARPIGPCKLTFVSFETFGRRAAYEQITGNIVAKEEEEGLEEEEKFRP